MDQASQQGHIKQINMFLLSNMSLLRQLLEDRWELRTLRKNKKNTNLPKCTPFPQVPP